MSRAYLLRIPLEMCLSEREREDRGKMEFSFDLLGILPPEKMKELMGKLLEAAGWRPVDGHYETTLPGGARASVDLARMRLEVDISPTLGDHAEVNVYEESLRGTGIEAGARRVIEVTELPPQLASRVQEAVARQLEAAREPLLRAAIQGRQQLNALLKDVYREAIKEKARSLGNITSVSESSQDGTMRIRVEIAS